MAISDNTPLTVSPQEKRCPHCEKYLPATTEYFCIDRRVDRLQSWCKKCTTQNRKAPKNTEARRDARKRYKLAHLDKIRSEKREYSRRFRQRCRDKKQAYNTEYYTKYPERKKAHAAVRHAVINGIIQKVSEHKCSVCGKQAEHYHHHNGYGDDHLLDVVPVCAMCHSMIERQQAGDRNV